MVVPPSESDSGDGGSRPGASNLEGQSPSREGQSPSRQGTSPSREHGVTGARLGRYEILGILGRGAVGTVYLAYDPQIDRRVAIKTLQGLDQLPEQERLAARARFLSEARAAGRLSHAHVLTIFDVGEEEETPYIAMELLDGVSLEAHAHPPDLLAVHEVLALIEQACEALNYAHAAGVVHRDIKPANLMLVADGTLKITDFGLAKIHDANLTTDGSLLGTPYYMSPEQIRGEPLDGRSDLFSLGAVLYQLLTGALPFPGDTIHTVIHRILTEPPGEIPVDGRVSAPLRELLHRALDKNRETRIATGAEFRAVLRRIGKELRARPASSAGDTAGDGGVTLATSKAFVTLQHPPRSPLHRPRRGRAILGAGTLAGFVLVGGAYLVYVKGLADRGSDRARLEAVTPPPPPELAETEQTVRIVTDLPSRLFLDGRALSGPTFRIARGDTAEHRIRAVSGCRAAETVVNAAAPSGDVRLTLQPERARLDVVTTPDGAAVAVNGREQAGRTPLTIEIDRCEESRIHVTRHGFRALEYRLKPDDDPAVLAAALSTIEFHETEPGTLRVERGPYEARVFLGGKLLGGLGESLVIPAGRQTLEIQNEALFLRLKRALSIKPAEQALWRPDWPVLGTLTVQATPTNCSIHVRPRSESSFRYLDDVPVVHHRLAPGVYTIRCTLLTTHESQEKDVELLPGGDESIDFTFLR